MLNCLQNNGRTPDSLCPGLVVYHADKSGFIGRQLGVLKTIFVGVVRAPLQPKINLTALQLEAGELSVLRHVLDFFGAILAQRR